MIHIPYHLMGMQFVKLMIIVWEYLEVSLTINYQILCTNMIQKIIYFQYYGKVNLPVQEKDVR